MPGPSISAGAQYQARLCAFACAHVLSGSRLGWIDDLADIDDVPVAVSAETEGAGDDVGIELRNGRAFEVQAKHKISAGASLAEAVAKVVERSAAKGATPVVFAVDRASGNTVARAVARDLRRLRAGREDHISAATVALRQAFGEDAVVLKKLAIVPCDLDDAGQLEAKLAQEQLARVLKDSTKAREAWIILSEKGLDLARERGRIDRIALASLLKSAAGIEVLPLGPNAAWNARLDLVRALVDRDHTDAALKELSVLERDMTSGGADAHVAYRLHVLRATSLYKKGKYEDAIAGAERALQSEREGAHALAIASHASLALRRLDDARRYAERAVAAHGDEAVAWIAKAAVDASGIAPSSSARRSSPRKRASRGSCSTERGRSASSTRRTRARRSGGGKPSSSRRS